MATSKFADVGIRAASGAVFVGITVFSIWFSAYTLAAVYGIFMLGAIREFYKLNAISNTPQAIFGLGASVTFYGLSSAALLQFIEFKYILCGIFFVVIALISATFSAKEKPFASFGIMMAGLAYATLPFIAVVFVGIDAYAPSDDIHRPFPLLLFMVLVWITDTFAYLSGKFFGKNHMAPTISPGKTWEGTGGGVFTSLLVAGVVSYFFPEENIATIFVIWFSASILAVLGDLSESRLKRSVNVKDSGNFMPGHGGFLDRFDSLLLSAPILMIYFLLI